MTEARADVVRDHNRRAWTQQVANGNPWTIPVTAADVADARQGRWGIYLTPTRTVPMAWFPPLIGCDLLCLAFGGRAARSGPGGCRRPCNGLRQLPGPIAEGPRRSGT